MDENVWEEVIQVNPAQAAFLVMPYKNGYVIYSRATGKSFITGAVIDDNIRLMPRGITTLTQATIGQALTKTLPSAFKMLEMLGYKQWDPVSKTGDYVVCRRPIEGWYKPYEHIMSFEYGISFSNGHMLYILTQGGNSRGPNADYNITDEALTLERKIQLFLTMSLRAYRVPEEEIEKTLAYIAGRDIRAVSERVMHILFQTLAMRYEFSLSDLTQPGLE